jgi:hypothetical protein
MRALTIKSVSSCASAVVTLSISVGIPNTVTSVESVARGSLACLGRQIRHIYTMEGYTCVSCRSIHQDFDGVLEVTFDGWGDRGVIDTFSDGPQTRYICYKCAEDMFKIFPWMCETLRGFLNINYAHTCIDGDIRWSPQSQCYEDFDRHGWRKVYLVRPAGRQVGENSCYYNVFDAEEDAVSACEALNRNLRWCRVSEINVGSLHYYTQISLADSHSEFDYPHKR